MLSTLSDLYLKIVGIRKEKDLIDLTVEIGKINQIVVKEMIIFSVEILVILVEIILIMEVEIEMIIQSVLRVVAEIVILLKMMIAGEENHHLAETLVIAIEIILEKLDR